MRPPLIVLLCLTIFSNTFSIGAFPALLPEISSVGRLADWQLGAVAGVFGFARMLADIPVGLFITHRLRQALLLAPFVLAGGVLLLASGGPFEILLLGRGLMGVGHALGMVGGLTAILRYQTGWALSSSLNAFELSAMLGILGGTVTIGALPKSLAWNMALLITCTPQLIGILVLPALRSALPRGDAAAGAPLFARKTGDARPSERGRLTPLVALAFAAGGAIAVTYSTMEQFMIPVRGSREFGLDRSGVARVLMTMQLFDIAALLPAGVLSDRRGVRRVLGVVMLFLGGGASMIGFGSFPLVVTGCALFGLGMAGWMLPLSVLRGETPPDRIAWRAALYRVTVDGGMFLGPFLSGLLAGSYIGLLPGVFTGVLLMLGVLLLRSRPAS